MLEIPNNVYMAEFNKPRTLAVAVSVA